MLSELKLKDGDKVMVLGRKPEVDSDVPYQRLVEVILHTRFSIRLLLQNPEFIVLDLKILMITKRSLKIIKLNISFHPDGKENTAITGRASDGDCDGLGRSRAGLSQSRATHRTTQEDGRALEVVA